MSFFSSYVYLDSDEEKLGREHLFALHNFDMGSDKVKAMVTSFAKQGAAIDNDALGAVIRMIKKLAENNGEIILRESDKTALIGLLRDLSNKAKLESEVTVAGSDDGSGDDAAKSEADADPKRRRR